MQKIFVVGLVAVLGALGAAYFAGEFSHIPVGAATEGSMWLLKDRIVDFAMESGRAPQTLNELPASQRIGDTNLDEWGHPIDYSVAGNVVSLISLGNDGQVGGMNENADIVRKFPLCYVKGCAAPITPWANSN